MSVYRTIGPTLVFKSLLCFNDTIYKVRLESIIHFKDIKQKHKFGQNLKFLNADVTLKIR